MKTDNVIQLTHYETFSAHQMEQMQTRISDAVCRNFLRDRKLSL